MIKKTCKSWTQGLAVLCLFLIGTSAHAAPITELGLGIDGSGSIDSDDFDLQIDAYRNVLTDSSIVPQDGSIAIGIWMFSSSVSSLYSTTVIDSSTSSVSDLDDALVDVDQPEGQTDIAGAISTAADDLLTNGIDSSRQIIDISTDGDQTVSGNPDNAASTAVNDGIEQVNCLGIGTGADCGFTEGAGSFDLTASDFDDFEGSLEGKIVRETQVPAPATLALFGLGLLTMGAVSARRRDS
ncbi:MAG: DUF1194 domain-containing protein [Halorhodospira sp.]